MELSTNFLEKLIKLNGISSTDKTRYALSGVWWFGNQLLASDGHCAGKFDVEEISKTKLFFSSEDCKSIQAMLKKTKYPIAYTLTDKLLEGAGNKIFLAMDCTETEYPPIETILYPKHVEEFTISFNAELLFDLAKAGMLDKGTRPIIKFTLDKNNKMSPIIVKSHQMQGVLMPCKI